ncbi:hypothetical protein AQUCO_04700105v1 [Aquilegia coerulea]|uniref:F-box domain-containing protein n=1 Tax=Aquilegia coerulea TaxID=218851 RepID=A0A2G5CL40_AQUCA|nr:hypothetical protein AQUCO_04700105v1 [Aquilegia coerulea]
MNANTSSSTVNFRKEGEEDRISNLPDDVLQHILCFLPTIDVVATSVLSTRWKYLWTATGSLDFCDEMIRNVKMINYPMCNMKLMNIVEKILLLHDAPFIRRFSLYSSTTLDESRVNTWISAVIKRKVEEIIIYIFVEHSHLLLLGSLLSCESLKIFKFKGPSFFKLPSSSVFFSNLKVLHLFFIQVSGDQAIQNVSLNFPMLDEVVLYYCEWLNLKVVNIFAPALNRLTIAHDHHHSSDDYYDDCKIKIYAENLVTLDFRTTLAYDISLHNLSSLYKACIYIWSEDHLPHRMIKFLKGIYHVTDLTLFDGTICVSYLFSFHYKFVQSHLEKF